MHIRVASEMKALARTVAARGGITERQARLYVRLDPEDRRLLSDRSNGRGMASATYAALPVRAHLRGAAPLPKSEYLALRQSILELTAVGSNLNQIVQTMNWAARGVLECQ